VGSGTAENIVIGTEPSTGAADNTIYTGSGVNTLQGLADTINANSTLGFTASVVFDSSTGKSSLALESGTSGSAGTLTVNTEIPDSAGNVNPSFIADGIGVSASVVTKNNQSTLELASQTAGSSGALTVASSINANSDALLSASTTSASTKTNSTATLTSIPKSSDVLTGSISIQVGTGTAQTITIGSSSNTLSTLAQAINKASIGASASVVFDGNGSHLLITSSTTGSDGDLTVTSSVLDTTNTSTATLHYANSSDINNLSSLGITVNSDGSLTFDAASMDSVLNSDFSSVVGFFQNTNSWGQTFSSILTNAGTSSTSGVLSLASTSNSNIESTLNADISREESLISAESKSLTTELNTANQTIQNIPNLLSQVNQLYSAITGYNQSK
jgi:flagellar hook-associated protein 2